MSEEVVKIAVSRFRDKTGQPTCAEDHPGGRVCQFYLTIGLAQRGHCFLLPNKSEDARYNRLYRRGKRGDGSPIPDEKCPLWQGEQ